MLRVQNMCREMGVLAVNKQRLGKRVSIQSLSQFVKIQTVNAVSETERKGEYTIFMLVKMQTAMP